MVLLIITNSVDITSDILCTICEEHQISVFRWNIDLWDKYQVNFTSTHKTISDPCGFCVDLSDESLVMLWRKPHLDLFDAAGYSISKESKKYARTQVREWLNFIVEWLRRTKRLKLIDPMGDTKVPKLLQLEIASKYFSIPAYEFFTHRSTVAEIRESIAKSLGDPSVGEKILYTTRVEKENLITPFPWFTQEKVSGGKDVTCVYINGQSWFYTCEFKRGGNAIDWRVEINTPGQSEWNRTFHSDTAEWGSSVKLFMEEVGLLYGRLDFILLNDDLIFLECNTNGQFGWLDKEPTRPLHREFLWQTLASDTAI